MAAVDDDGSVSELVDALRFTLPTPTSWVGVAPQDGGERVVGPVMLSTSRLDAPPRLVEVLVLSPLGVHPEFQRLGLGTRLIKTALESADAAGEPLVFLEGSPTY